MIQFDLISDVHLDFWVDNSSNQLKLSNRLDQFVASLVPEFPAKTLIIAGDLGHYNKQNLMLLTKLKMYYSRILLVAGNHDYYLISKSLKNKYTHNERTILTA
ncbi:metallophosphoesterase [Paenibacillus albidus]|uniref:metallophosphoesterase n=1 Tax=Paenibacillus albidus TaxID=2041023 RepID=UPI001BE99326|nr:metallophosphoesterase [Paenibacillus albidus]MBT2292076.1 metallophosphoesterase [Paenibacillus albidus]